MNWGKLNMGFDKIKTITKIVMKDIRGLILVLGIWFLIIIISGWLFEIFVSFIFYWSDFLG